MPKIKIVYMPQEVPVCPKCEGVDFVPIMKDDTEYGKCVKCGCEIEATHYEVEDEKCDDGCDVDFDTLKPHGKK
jgi:Zn ribbon nucleic-acid-binding protein